MDTGDPHLPPTFIFAEPMYSQSGHSGASLDKRGYRLDRKRRPARNACRGDSGTVGLGRFFYSYGSMCGSGTIPIEAALKASRRAPGCFVTIRLSAMARFDGSHLAKNARRGREQDLPALISRSVDPTFGRGHKERPAQCKARRSRAARKLQNLDFGDAVHPHLRNCHMQSPYGVRLSDEEALKPLYGRLGDVLKRRFSGYTAYLLVGTPPSRPVSGSGHPQDSPFHGPIEVVFLRYEMVLKHPRFLCLQTVRVRRKLFDNRNCSEK